MCCALRVIEDWCATASIDFVYCSSIFPRIFVFFTVMHCIRKVSLKKTECPVFSRLFCHSCNLLCTDFCNLCESCSECLFSFFMKYFSSRSLTTLANSLEFAERSMAIVLKMRFYKKYLVYSKFYLLIIYQLSKRTSKVKEDRNDTFSVNNVGSFRKK